MTQYLVKTVRWTMRIRWLIQLLVFSALISCGRMIWVGVFSSATAPASIAVVSPVDDILAPSPPTRASSQKQQPRQAPSTQADFSLAHLPDWLNAYIAQQNMLLRYALTSSKRNTKHSAILRRDAKILKYECKPSHPCGGVGDRLHGMMTALYLATNRTLLIQSIHPDSLQNYLVPNRLMVWNATYSRSGTRSPPFVFDGMDTRSNHSFLMEPDSIPQDPQIILARLNTFRSWQIEQSSCFHRLQTNRAQSTIVPHQSRQQPTMKQMSSSASFTVDNLQYYLFWTLFRFSDAVQKRALELKQHAGMIHMHPNSPSAFFEQQQQLHHNDHYVAVHVRTGDQGSFSNGNVKRDDGDESRYTNPTSTHDKHKADSYSINKSRQDVRHANPSDWRQFYECSRKLQQGLEKKCLGGSNRMTLSLRNHSTSIRANKHDLGRIDIYVASDSIEAKQALKQYGHNGSDTAIKMTSMIKIYHNDHLIMDKEPNRQHHPQRGKPQGSQRIIEKNAKNLDVWAEFYILVNATCLVHSRSGFSETAAAIGPNQCAVRFDQCSDEQVAAALNGVDC